MKFFLHNLILFALLSVVFAAASCQRIVDRPNSEPVNQPNGSPSSQIALLPYGNPSNAGTDPDNFLLVHRSHTLSYNNSRGTLNWIAWRTTAADLGEKRERSRFEEDRTLPDSFRRVQYYDYSGSGYDRGHMVPAADRFADESLMEETFLMTNIVPQTGDLNQFPWNKLESYARGIARSGSELYTIAGVYGEKGRLRGKVTIPTNCWKVIVIIPRGQNGITRSTRIIAVDMPNIDGIENENWQRYQTTVREIEQRTGLDLFSAIPRDVQDIIETKTMTASPLKR